MPSVDQITHAHFKVDILDPATGLPIVLGGSSDILTAVKDITAEQMLTLLSDPIEIIPAPGAGLAIVPVSGFAELAFGTEAYKSLALVLTRSGSVATVGQFDTTLAGASADAVAAMNIVLEPAPKASADNTPVEIITDAFDLGDFGAIATSSLDDGGADYEVGDTFAVGGGDDAEGEVDTVDGGGAVLTYHLTNTGSDYSALPAIGTDTLTGIGTGLALNIDTITPQGNGTLRVTVWYRIVTLVS